MDDQGAYFTADELDGAVDDYALTAPENVGQRVGWAGIDWGFARDSSAVVVMSLMDERRDRLPWIDEAVHVGYSEFVARVVAVARGDRLMRLASECNGVGAMPSQELRRMIGGRTSVVEVTTTNDSKQDAFGRVKLLFSQGRLRLPRHPRLLSQLSSLEFEEMDSGRVRIAVPERSGHDDLAMALCLAAGAADVESGPARAIASPGQLPTRVGRHDDPPCTGMGVPPP